MNRPRGEVGGFDRVVGDVAGVDLVGGEGRAATEGEEEGEGRDDVCVGEAGSVLHATNFETRRFAPPTGKTFERSKFLLFLVQVGRLGSATS